MPIPQAPGVGQQMLYSFMAKQSSPAKADQSPDPLTAPPEVTALGMTPRQQKLNLLWAFYLGQHYDARKTDWTGRQTCGDLEREALATSPHAFHDRNVGDPLPPMLRRPTVPSGIVSQIVNRFTGLLFSTKKRPSIRCPADLDTEDFVNQVAKEGNLWTVMGQARTLGGATGSACVAFLFKKGKPHFTVFNPCWTQVEFEDEDTFTVGKLDRRTARSRQVFTGTQYQTRTVVERVVVDKERWITYFPIPVDKIQSEPWREDPSRTVEHGFGFCPAVWIQNLPLADDIDGLPDCANAYDHIRALDMLLSQAYWSVFKNCDPTIVITDKEFDTNAILKTGSDHFLHMKGDGGNASFLESQHQGAGKAMEIVDKLKADIYKITACVTELPELHNRTATEVDAVLSPVYERADSLRSQYGEGCDRLCEMVLQAIRNLKGANKKIVLQPKVSVEGEKRTVKEREIGNGEYLELQWPSYLPPEPTLASSIVSTAQMAQSGGLISKRTALEYLKPVFGFNDIDEELKAIKADAEEAEASAAEGMEGGEEGMMGGEEGMPPEEMPQEGYPLEEGAYPPDPAQPYAPEGYPPEAYPPEEAPFPQEGLPPQEAAPPLEEAPPVEENATFSYPEEEQPPIPPEEEEGTGKMIDISLPEIRLKKIKEGMKKGKQKNE